MKRLNSSLIKSLASGIAKGDHGCLAKAITLAESSRADHRDEVQSILNEIVKMRKEQCPSTDSLSSSSSLRIGVTGPPGAGKSTFIEALGLSLLQHTHSLPLAVLSVDPSSPISGGAILGDLTRMHSLSLSPSVFVRGSPSRGVLGGVTQHIYEVMRLCELSGKEIILLESVGQGQSEIELHQVVDMTILLLPPVGGDELQASKKGIMEVADCVLISKGDGDLRERARQTRQEVTGAMKYVHKRYEGWTPPVMMISSATGEGVREIESVIKSFYECMREAGEIQRKRECQAKYWMWTHFRRKLVERGECSVAVQKCALSLIPLVEREALSPSIAAEELIETFLNR
eukprot:CAMPEP_0182424126 /NCGR_PEP_ID=MMETSP1167-20130531/10280_1 /TAXON_ID=2988 /ORGANISM="Mallomonas Sp, Strain CCMP3275" /LENGTH=344 /DNA_ID=CAMNT_0024603681 /DNA_START=336 /DNA_END=1370 /DNA_ORIENTATION=+